MMGKQNFSKKQWQKSLANGECPYGCSLTKEPCKHLEAVIPSMDAGRIYRDVTGEVKSLIFTDNLEILQKYAVKLDIELDDLQIEQFVTTLVDFGFDETVIQILADKYIHNKTYKDIQDKWGYPSEHMVHNIVHHAIKRIERLLSKESSNA